MSIFVELAVSDRRNKKEIRHLEQELPKWQVLVDSVTGNTEMIPCPESFFTCPCIYVIYKMSVLGDWVDSHLFTIFSKYVILGLINPCKISSQRLFWLRLVKDVRMFYYLHVASCEVNKCYIHCALRGEYNVLSKVVSRDVSQSEKTSEVILSNFIIYFIIPTTRK